jgi:hypothetical protein
VNQNGSIDLYHFELEQQDKRWQVNRIAVPAVIEGVPIKASQLRACGQRPAFLRRLAGRLSRQGKCSEPTTRPQPGALVSGTHTP